MGGFEGKGRKRGWKQGEGEGEEGVNEESSEEYVRGGMELRGR